MPVRVANIRKHRRSDGEVRVYVGRHTCGYKASPLGNPIKLGAGATKGETLEAYRDWLRGAVKGGSSPQAKELVRLASLVAAGEDVVLLCWCHPAPCHGDVICAAVERVAARING